MQASSQVTTTCFKCPCTKITTIKPHVQEVMHVMKVGIQTTTRQITVQTSVKTLRVIFNIQTVIIFQAHVKHARFTRQTWHLGTRNQSTQNKHILLLLAIRFSTRLFRNRLIVTPTFRVPPSATVIDHRKHFSFLSARFPSTFAWTFDTFLRCWRGNTSATTLSSWRTLWNIFVTSFHPTIHGDMTCLTAFVTLDFLHVGWTHRHIMTLSALCATWSRFVLVQCSIQNRIPRTFGFLTFFFLDHRSGRIQACNNLPWLQIQVLEKPMLLFKPTCSQSITWVWFPTTVHQTVVSNIIR